MLPADICQARRKRNAGASHDWRRFAMRERFASMAHMIRYMVQVSGQLHDIAEGGEYKLRLALDVSIATMMST